MQQNSGSSIGLYNTFSSAKKNQSDERISIPYYKAYSDRIVIYPRLESYAGPKNINDKSLNNLKKKKYNGNLSVTQKRKIKQKLTAWLQSIITYNRMTHRRYQKKEHYPVFITLTLSDTQNHTDKEIRRNMLDLFIKNIKNRFGVKYYFWRAETQKNGNIHYHIITDKYILHSEIRNIWNRIQLRYGYLDNYLADHGHIDANSTDIKSAKDVKNFINYVLKYTVKDENNRKIEGKVFGMSEELRTINVYQDVLDNEMSDYLIKMKDLNLTTTYNQEYYSVIFFNKSFYDSIYSEKLEHYQGNFYYELYTNLYEKIVEMPKVVPKRICKLKNDPEQLKLFKLSEILKSYNRYKYLVN